MLAVQEETVGDLRLIALSGTFDFYGIQAFKQVLSKAYQDQMHFLLIDMTKISFLDSASLGTIVATHKALSRRKGQLILIVDPESFIGEILLSASIRNVMPIFSTREEALKQFAVPAETSS